MRLRGQPDTTFVGVSSGNARDILDFIVDRVSQSAMSTAQAINF